MVGVLPRPKSLFDIPRLGDRNDEADTSSDSSKTDGTTPLVYVLARVGSFGGGRGGGILRAFFIFRHRRKKNSPIAPAIKSAATAEPTPIPIAAAVLTPPSVADGFPVSEGSVERESVPVLGAAVALDVCDVL